MARRLMLKTLLADAERAGIRVDADGRGRFEIGRRERGIVVNAAGYMCRWADADQVLPPRCGLADAYAPPRPEHRNGHTHPRRRRVTRHGPRIRSRHPR